MKKNTHITDIRLVNHQLLQTGYTTPRQIVAHLGIVQAQDFNAAKWAIGTRLGGCTDKSVSEAFDKGEILRTHIMRPTWHFVTPENIRWMLQLSAKQIMQSMKSRDRELGITAETYSTCFRIIEKALEKENFLTKDELAKILHQAGMTLDSSQLYHVMVGAEANGIVCSGALQGNMQTYALLEKRAPPAQPLSKEESLAKLARIYFSGHGSATLNDFVWWSGLSVGEARQGLHAIQAELVSETINGQLYWMPDIVFNPPVGKSRLFLLPAFDEYIVGYKDRTDVLTSVNHTKAISSNGVFRPVIIKDGQVIGLWKKATSAKKIIEIAPFESVDETTQQSINAAAEKFHAFI